MRTELKEGRKKVEGGYFCHLIDWVMLLFKAKKFVVVGFQFASRMAGRDGGLID